jgi:hypothetical protein
MLASSGSKLVGAGEEEGARGTATEIVAGSE